MAKEKLEQKSARPHFTRKEQDKIKAELGLGMCAESLYVCINCNKKPPEDVTLSRCSQCLGVWYCSKKCRTVHWRESRHIERCRKDAATTMTVLPDSHGANNEEQIVAYGYAPVRGSGFRNGRAIRELDQPRRVFWCRRTHPSCCVCQWIVHMILSGGEIGNIFLGYWREGTNGEN